MISKEKLHLDVKWATRQRLQYIEVMAYYAGVVSRSDVARAFDISDAAATKDLKLYGQLAPDNLLYKHQVFGFVPTPSFAPVFANLAPAQVLPILATNGIQGLTPPNDSSIFGIEVETLPLPNRFPTQTVLAQITRAIKGHNKLRATYHSLSDRHSPEQRILEPHSLVNTGLRWHVRAYSNNTYDFRDFVLSRFAEAIRLDEPAESNMQYDDEWIELVTLQLSPHPRLDARKRASLLMDYNATNEIIELQIRRALIGYVLQRLSVDTTAGHTQNPASYQLIVINREEIEPFASWAFQS